MWEITYKYRTGEETFESDAQTILEALSEFLCIPNNTLESIIKAEYINN